MKGPSRYSTSRPSQISPWTQEQHTSDYENFFKCVFCGHRMKHVDFSFVQFSYKKYLLFPFSKCLPTLPFVWVLLTAFLFAPWLLWLTICILLVASLVIVWRFFWNFDYDVVENMLIRFTKLMTCRHMRRNLQCCGSMSCVWPTAWPKGRGWENAGSAVSLLPPGTKDVYEASKSEVMCETCARHADAPHAKLSSDGSECENESVVKWQYDWLG